MMKTNEKMKIEFSRWIAASPNDVWLAMTTRGGIMALTGGKMDGEMTPGAAVTVDWKSEGFGRYPVKFLEIDPGRRLTFRWHHSPDMEDAEYTDDKSTLVEIDLAPEGAGTRVNLKESGFEALPASMIETLDAVNSGWPVVLDRLETRAKDPYVIRQELILKATPEAVWQALTTAEHWTGWFSERVEGDFSVGSVLKLDFGSHGICAAKVVERDEMRAFAYRWHPGEDCPIDKYPESEMTTVRFQIEPHPEGTKFTLTEEGFERIPEPRRFKALGSNDEGWGYMARQIEAYLERGERQALSQKEG